MSRIVKLADFAHVSLATAAKTVLEESGIRCSLQSDVLSESLFTRNAGFGSARLLVAEEDLAAAQQLLTSLQEQADDDATSWLCTACQEEIEAGFAACWSCGRTRDEVGGERPARSAENATPLDFTDPARAAARPLEPLSPLHPYASPRTLPEDELEHDTTAEPEQLSVADDFALRAYRAAVFGFLLFPCLPVLHGYAAWLVWQSSRVEPPATPRGERYATLATALITLVGLPLLGALFWQLFG